MKPLDKYPAPLTRDKFGTLFGPMQDYTPNQRAAFDFACDLERKLAMAREALVAVDEAIAKTTLAQDAEDSCSRNAVALRHDAKLASDRAHDLKQSALAATEPTP